MVTPVLVLIRQAQTNTDYPKHQDWLYRLGTWNLKYDEFPQIEICNNLISIEYYMPDGKKEFDVIEYYDAAVAEAALQQFNETMTKRSKAFWQIA